MHHRMPPSKTGWPSLNVVILPPVMRLVLDDTKQWPPRRLLVEFMSFFRRDPNDFLSRLVTVAETWLYHCDPKTKQQSMEWWHSGWPRPKKFRVQKSAGTVLPSIFWDQDGILFIDYLPKGQTINAEYYSPLLVQLKDILKEKTPREGHKCDLVLAWQCPGSPGTSNPEETGLPGLPVSWSPILFSGSGPVRLSPVPWTEKKNWKVAIFLLTWRSLLPRRPGRTDNVLNFFFEWLTEVRATG